MDVAHLAESQKAKKLIHWPCGPILRIMLIDRSEITKEKTYRLLQAMLVDAEPKLHVEFNSCIDETLTYLRWQTFDLILINTNVIDAAVEQHNVFEKIRTLFHFSPIIALTSESGYLNSMNLISQGVDDCLELSVINEKVLTRVIANSLQRAKNYRKLKLSSDAQQVINRLLSLSAQGLEVRALLQSCLNLITLDADFVDDDAESAILLTQDGMLELKIVASSHRVEEGIEERTRLALANALSDMDWDISSIFCDSEDKPNRVGRRYIPIIHQNKILGVFVFYLKPGFLDNEDEQFFAQKVSHCLGGILNVGRQRRNFLRVFEQNKRLIRSMSSAIVGVDAKDTVTQWNKAAEEIFGLSINEVEGKPILTLPIQWDWGSLSLQVITSLENRESSERFEVRFKKPEGRPGILSAAVTPLLNPHGDYDGYLLLIDDVTEERLEREQKQQAERLQSIGQLAAGVAHEINTPIQYVGDNLCFLEESFNEFLQLSNRCTSLAETDSSFRSTELGQLVDDLELDYLNSEVPEAIKETKNGVEHVSSIVRAMKEFSHPGTKEKVATDLNNIINNTLVITRNIWKYVAEVETHLFEALPPVPTFPGPINEVILNLIVNASDAISDTGRQGKITIQTGITDKWAEVRICDTGGGIPDSIKKQVFDPFFTTKEVGKGTGQGLSICYKIIVEEHLGALSFTTDEEGTCFLVQLPLEEGSK